MLPTKQTGLTTVVRRFEEISAAKLLKTRDEITEKKTNNPKSARRVACKFEFPRNSRNLTKDVTIILLANRVMNLAQAR